MGRAGRAPWAAVVLALTAVLALAAGVRAQQWPPACAEGSLDAAATNVAVLDWDDAATHFVALNATDGTVQCQVAQVNGSAPFGMIGANLFAVAGRSAFAVLQSGAGSAVLYAVDAFRMSALQLCTFPAAYAPYTLNANAPPGDDDGASAVLTASGYRNSRTYDVWRVDTATCEPTVLASLPVPATGLDLMNAHAADWALQVLYVHFRPAASDAGVIAAFDLTTGAVALTNLTVANPSPKPYAGAQYVMSFVVPLPLSGAHATASLFAYFADAQGIDPNRYWGQLEPGTGVLTVVSASQDANVNVMSGGSSNALRIGTDWRVSAFGFSDSPAGNKLYQFNALTGQLVTMSTGSVVSSIWAVILRPPLSAL